MDNIMVYGWQGLIVAFTVCLIIGLIKTPIKNRILNKCDAAKVSSIFGAIALILSIVLGIVGAIIYWAIYEPFEIISTASLAFVVWVVSGSQFFYTIYEKLGGRALFKKIILAFLDKNNDNKITIDEILTAIKSKKLDTEGLMNAITKTIQQPNQELDLKKETDKLFL